MKTRITRNYLPLITVFFLLNSFVSAAEGFDESKKKEINKSFDISLSDQLSVDNRYGSITVTHWTKNEVAIRVVVEAKASSDSRAQETLDRVSIELSQSGNTVLGVTNLSSNWVNGNNVNLSIDYYISMPSKLSASLSQKYGNINLPNDNEGKCNLEVKYGNIKAGNFTEALNIEAGYSNVVVGNVPNVNLEVAYCRLVEVGNAKAVNVDSKYSDITLQNADQIRLDGKYGNLKMNKVGTVNMELKYSEATFEYVKDDLTAGSIDYSTVIIKELAPSFKRVYTEARYGTLKISISKEASFRITAENMKYGKVDTNGLKVTDTHIDNKVHYDYQINGGGSSTIRFDGGGYANLVFKAL